MTDRPTPVPLGGAMNELERDAVDIIREQENEIHRLTARLAAVESERAAVVLQIAEWAKRTGEAEARVQQLEEALQEAKELIREWHNMGTPAAEAALMWAIYDEHSPEMRKLNALLSRPVPAAPQGHHG